MEAVAREAIEEACSLLGASPVETKKYPVILKNSVICEMLSMYLPPLGRILCGKISVNWQDRQEKK